MEFKLEKRKCSVLIKGDSELVKLLNSNRITTKLLPNEISCILDYLEISQNSSVIWKSIASELNSLGEHNYNCKKWQQIFNKLCLHIKNKKEILDKLDKQLDNTSNFLNQIEIRLLEFLKDTNYHLEDDSNDDSDDHIIVCRVCLNTASEHFWNIHVKTSSIEETFARKMNICTEIEQIRKDDGLPQHICKNCVSLLENAFKFKILCEQSDSKLRRLNIEVEEEDDDGNHELIDVDYGELLADDEDKVTENKFCIEDSRTIETPKDNQEKSTAEIEKVTNLIEDNFDRTKRIFIASKGTEIPDKLLNVEESIHQCEICGIVCYNEKSLKRHFHAHKISRPYQCDTCNKEFKTKISLRIHMRSHTGERPYVCEACGKAFKTWSAVATHRAVHSEVKEFRCHQCSYQANTKANLQIHSRIHTGVQPYACNQCPLKFSTASNRSKHIKNIHEKKKFHKCTSCDRSFFSKETLRKHKVIHTGLKPYTCPECPMAYSWYNGLQKHMKTQHEKVKIPTEKFYLNQIYN